MNRRDLLKGLGALVFVPPILENLAAPLAETLPAISPDALIKNFDMVLPWGCNVGDILVTPHCELIVRRVDPCGRGLAEILSNDPEFGIPLSDECKLNDIVAHVHSSFKPFRTIHGRTTG
ncbi:hypothetical protein GCM10028806_33600 [Spirosoma terrae]